MALTDIWYRSLGIIVIFGDLIMELKYHANRIYMTTMNDALVRDLDRWIKFLDSSNRFGTPISVDGTKELKDILLKALERIEENEKNFHNL